MSSYRTNTTLHVLKSSERTWIFASVTKITHDDYLRLPLPEKHLRFPGPFNKWNSCSELQELEGTILRGNSQIRWLSPECSDGKHDFVPIWKSKIYTCHGSKPIHPWYMEFYQRLFDYHLSSYSSSWMGNLPLTPFIRPSENLQLHDAMYFTEIIYNIVVR